MYHASAVSPPGTRGPECTSALAAAICSSGRIWPSHCGRWGCCCRDERGLILRAGSRDGVLREAVENSFYDGRQDAWIRVGSAALKQLLSPLFTGEDATARTVVYLEALTINR